MGRPVVFLGPWDLDLQLGVLQVAPGSATILLVESVAKGAAMPWHRQKLVLVLSAIHHFARTLREAGHDVHLVRSGSYVQAVREHVQAHDSAAVHAMRPREWGLQHALAQADFGVPLHLHDDGGPGGHFLLPRDEFARWAAGERGPQLRMDRFYRWMRERTGILMDASGPVGGRFSFDVDNRKAVPRGVRPPAVPRHAPDAITREILDRVAGWPGLWGSAEGFGWPVTRQAALEELEHFVQFRLAGFGDYQDALVQGEAWLWHARLSTSLNLGLLRPDDVVERVVAALHEGAPINAVEGLVRQVLGWREFMRGIYWLRMPGLRDANLLDADRPLPAAYWDPAKTEMACLRDAVSNVVDHGYAHHIQRLMVLGNFALLTGVRPLDISHWFWAGFVDAYEWVELPNVHGMAVFADDTFTTKPYAASGNYVNKMGDHCRGCRYDVKAKHGPDACPLNPLFWHFMARHRERLASNPRLARLYATWDRKPPKERKAALDTAASFLDALEPADHDWSFRDDAC